MRFLNVQARTIPEARWLKRELGAYTRKRRGRSLWIQLPDDRSGQYLADLLSAIESCLTANEIPTVKVNLDGKAYLLEAERLVPPARAEVLAVASTPAPAPE